MIRQSPDDGGRDGLRTWLRDVVAPTFGCPVLQTPDRRAWLSQLYEARGAVGASELRVAAAVTQRQVAEEACRRVQADLAHTVRSAGPVVSVVAEDSSIRIAYNGELSLPLLHSGAAWVCARGGHSVRIGELAAVATL